MFKIRWVIGLHKLNGNFPSIPIVIEVMDFVAFGLLADGCERRQKAEQLILALDVSLACFPLLNVVEQTILKNLIFSSIESK